MPTSFQIRAEFPNDKFADFKVTAETLLDARRKAEEYIEDNYISDRELLRQHFDWRGQVVFVNCQPAEEMVP